MLATATLVTLLSAAALVQASPLDTREYERGFPAHRDASSILRRAAEPAAPQPGAYLKQTTREDILRRKTNSKARMQARGAVASGTSYPTADDTPAGYTSGVYAEIVGGYPGNIYYVRNHPCCTRPRTNSALRR